MKKEELEKLLGKPLSDAQWKTFLDKKQENKMYKVDFGYPSEIVLGYKELQKLVELLNTAYWVEGAYSERTLSSEPNNSFRINPMSRDDVAKGRMLHILKGDIDASTNT